MTDILLRVDWRELFVPTQSIAEMIIRGTLMYLVLFALLRLILKRQSGGLGVTDVLVIVLIADAAQNAMASEYRSVTEGTVLVATIIFWDFALDWLGYRFPAFRRLIVSPPLLLVRDGQLVRRSMREELITRDELMSHLREQGVEEIAEVARAYMEPDGRISVLKRNGDKAGAGTQQNDIAGQGTRGAVDDPASGSN